MTGTRTACFALAILLHGTCMALAKTARISVSPITRRPSQVEIAVIEKPKPPPEVAPVEPPAPEAAPKRAPRPQPMPPAPASAAPVLARAEESASPRADEPVRFVSDPNGQRFGYGMVARGGSAQHGQAPPLSPAKPVVGGGEPIATRVSRAPALVSADGCKGFFPSNAQRDAGSVSVIATVRASGALAHLEIEREDPPGHGFGRAARACLERQRFTPALGLGGEPVAARTRVRIQFDR